MNHELLYLMKMRDKYFKKLKKDENNLTIKSKFQEIKNRVRNQKKFL